MTYLKCERRKTFLIDFRKIRHLSVNELPSKIIKNFVSRYNLKQGIKKYSNNLVPITFFYANLLQCYYVIFTFFSYDCTLQSI